MTLWTAAIALLSLIAVPSTHAQETKAMDNSKPPLTFEDVRSAFLRRWRPTRKIASSATYGNVRALRHATAASSRWRP
jgi:hypothetical protein